MLRKLTHAAFEVDAWLHRRLGRAYGIFLSIGLMGDIAHRVLDAPAQIQGRHSVVGIVLAVIMEIGVLLHQLGEMDERFGNREGKAAEPGART